MDIFQDGLGLETGPILVSGRPLRYPVGRRVLFVDSATGDDSGFYRGHLPEAPLATLAEAVYKVNTSVLTDSVIVLMPGHEETITSAITVTQRCTIVGGGISSGKPTAKLVAGGASYILVFVAPGSQLWNVRVSGDPGVAKSTAHVMSSADNVWFRDCYFEAGENDTASVDLFSTAHNVIEGCTFISTATAIDAQPGTAVDLDHVDYSNAYLRLVNNIFDNGEFGYGDPYALRGREETCYRFINNTQLRGASFRLGASATGYSVGGTRSSTASIKHTNHHT